MSNLKYHLAYGLSPEYKKQTKILNFLFRHFRSPLLEDQFYNNDEDYIEKHFASTLKNIPIIIYLHGNAFDR
jgi:hypothetical protein